MQIFSMQQYIQQDFLTCPHVYLGGAQLPVIMSWDWRDSTGRVLPVYMYCHCQGRVYYVDSTLLGTQVYCQSTGTNCAGDLAAV
jgi:hypothetical protein